MEANAEEYNQQEIPSICILKDSQHYYQLQASPSLIPRIAKWSTKCSVSIESCRYKTFYSLPGKASESSSLYAAFCCSFDYMHEFDFLHDNRWEKLSLV